MVVQSAQMSGPTPVGPATKGLCIGTDMNDGTKVMVRIDGRYKGREPPLLTPDAVDRSGLWVVRGMEYGGLMVLVMVVGVVVQRKGTTQSGRYGRQEWSLDGERDGIWWVDGYGEGAGWSVERSGTTPTDP
jgi:hypothetical protein